MRVSSKTPTILFAMMGFLGGCGGLSGHVAPASDPKIVGGSLVDADDEVAGSTVALVTANGMAFCTGSLIAKDYVLTAAHCLENYSKNELLYVAFGTDARRGEISRSSMRLAEDWYDHEEYDTEAMEEDWASRPPHDIALIKLVDPAPASASIVDMLSADDELHLGEDLILAGFGRQHHRARQVGVLYKVTTTLKTIVSEVMELHFGGNPGRSACMGDSGGPAFVVRDGSLKLVGVTSRGSEFCDEEGIYTDVRQFHAWLGEARDVLSGTSL